MAEKNKKSSSGSKKNLSITPRLQSDYLETVVPALMNRFDYGNIMDVPKVESVSINMGIGDGKTNSKAIDSAINELTLISGQKPVVTLSKKDISNFKIRKGWPVGCKVTLRSSKMYEFLDRLISIALPRTRDFRGLSFKSFDGFGNYNFGIQEQIIFTEIDYDKIQVINGMNVTLVTSAKSDDEAYWLLMEMGLPLRKKSLNPELEEVA
ncbi:MAG: 50S ribosomal protein L5 [Candidatus Marinimicrobia bacterium]|nr:50S ribosomal protein L5 [Candidatus Neomarinimicrobiota bacterium]|tara:strand:+ start:676 stop:1302 length:627 start_codon:yes stop_codon:yes gene_type:complete